MDAERVYYHGGPWGLSTIRPPNETRVACGSDFGGSSVHRRDRVYVTTSREAAALFASLTVGGRPTVYRVAPLGPVEADPDCDTPGLSFTCDRAHILGRSRISWKDVKRVRDALGVPNTGRAARRTN